MTKTYRHKRNARTGSMMLPYASVASSETQRYKNARIQLVAMIVLQYGTNREYCSQIVAIFAWYNYTWTKSRLFTVDGVEGIVRVKGRKDRT